MVWTVKPLGDANHIIKSIRTDTRIDKPTYTYFLTGQHHGFQFSELISQT